LTQSFSSETSCVILLSKPAFKPWKWIRNGLKAFPNTFTIKLLSRNRTDCEAIKEDRTNAFNYIANVRQKITLCCQKD